jgi:hypothetical protein
MTLYDDPKTFPEIDSRGRRAYVAQRGVEIRKTLPK